mgnify:CR=1 FL=1
MQNARQRSDEIITRSFKDESGTIDFDSFNDILLDIVSVIEEEINVLPEGTKCSKTLFTDIVESLRIVLKTEDKLKKI